MSLKSLRRGSISSQTKDKKLEKGVFFEKNFRKGALKVQLVESPTKKQFVGGKRGL